MLQIARGWTGRWLTVYSPLATAAVRTYRRRRRRENRCRFAARDRSANGRPSDGPAIILAGGGLRLPDSAPLRRRLRRPTLWFCRGRPRHAALPDSCPHRCGVYSATRRVVSSSVHYKPPVPPSSSHKSATLLRRESEMTFYGNALRALHRSGDGERRARPKLVL